MCTKLGIEHRFTPVCYLRYNGQVEPSLWDESSAPYRSFPPSIRKLGYEEGTNDERMKENFDFVDELRDRTLVRMQEQKQVMSRFYNRKVKNRQFGIWDLLLRLLQANQPKNRNKLNPKWEGPYRVRMVVGLGTYECKELSGKPIDHTWHEVYLKKYYV
ncbi:hypothetical protein LIER_29919 [Lithospermum erythrorhizon]|uniref:Uncharacterized protein n=1 Tax=Lithospermum erythrorhizon TaxID=34254 RepID=A0AAV3RP33_LITER